MTAKRHTAKLTPEPLCSGGDMSTGRSLGATWRPSLAMGERHLLLPVTLSPL